MREPVQGVQQEVKAFALRAIVDAVREVGKLDAVLPLLPSDTAALVTKPPLFAWVAARHTDRIMSALAKVGGVELVREVSERSVRGGMATVVAPLVRGLADLFGWSPAQLFGRMDTINEMTSRGLMSVYLAETDRSGTVQFIYSEALGEYTHIPLEVAILFGLDLAARKGKVTYRGRSEDGRVHTFWVEW